jgi:hypothetical protein
MMALRKLLCLVFLAAVMCGAAARASAADFSGGTFTCLDYTSGLGENSTGRMQSNLARLWMYGFLGGYYKAKDELEMSSEDAADTKTLDSAIMQTCNVYPSNSIFVALAKGIAPEHRKMPNAIARDFTPMTYTCGQHLDGKNGAAAAANKADLAEFWAFGFVQGYKNVSAPDFEIGAEFRPAITKSLLNACAARREELLMDVARMVADKVKIDPTVRKELPPRRKK